MNTKLNNLFIFTAGAVIGAVVAWKVTKDKYEQYIEELFEEGNVITVEDIIETCANEGVDVDISMVDKEESHALEEMRSAYNNIAQHQGYLPKEDGNMVKPYVISGEEFDKNADYDKESLTCFADGVLTDIGNDPIDFYSDLIGDVDPMKYYEEHGVDTVYVRNEETRCDYEILRDERNFNDIAGD